MNFSETCHHALTLGAWNSCLTFLFSLLLKTLSSPSSAGVVPTGGLLWTPPFFTSDFSLPAHHSLVSCSRSPPLQPPILGSSFRMVFAMTCPGLEASHFFWYLHLLAGKVPLSGQHPSNLIIYYSASESSQSHEMPLCVPLDTHTPLETCRHPLPH